MWWLPCWDRPAAAARLLQSCLTLCDPIDCSPPGSSLHRVLQARILEWVAMPFSRESSPPRDQTHISYISCIGRQVFITSTTCEASGIDQKIINVWLRLKDLLELTKKKKSPHHRGLEYKNRKWRDTWSNRQVCPRSTKWNRAKANRVLPREHIGHNKHSLPSRPRDDSTHGHCHMVSTEIRLLIFFTAEDGEALYSQ